MSVVTTLSSTQTSPLITFTNFNPVKLTRDNYPLWLPQIVPHLRGGNLFRYVDDSTPPPPSTVSSTIDGVTTTSPNPAFLHWTKQDQIILGAINSTLTEKMLTHVIRCTTSISAWTTLETLFTSQSRARTMQVHYQLAILKKGSSSVADYFQRFQSLTDSLATVGQPLNGFEMVAFLLVGLRPDYDPFVTSVTTRVEPLSVEEIYGHLLFHELRLEHHYSAIDLSVTGAHYAACGGNSFRPHRSSHNSILGAPPTGRGPSRPYFNRQSRGRGHNTHSFPGRGSSSRPVCQVCNRVGHIALDCYNRYNESFSRDSPQLPQAYLLAPSHGPDLNRYLNSGATHHVTSDMKNLNLKAEEFHSSDQIRIGNGKGLSIHHIGHTCLFSPTLQFDLLNVLHVPKISKNLLSVHKFTFDTNTFFEFHPDYFLLKDRRSKKLLLHGPNSHGLYQFPFFNNKSSLSILIGERVSFPQWHSRLGHPSLKLVRQILSSFQLPVSNSKVTDPCSACLSSKSKQLPFSKFLSRSTYPLELIYTDVWGPAPICSQSGFKYYVSFLDDFSRYTWLYPISCKGDVTRIFYKFKIYVECFFKEKIRTVQFDWGGEYRPFHTLLQSFGISHCVSCPHTHQQNGKIERKHRHIVETGLALLSHAKVPLQFWDDAFSTICYLINRMPTPVLQNKSPFHTLFHCEPDYCFLRTFSCACWPNLRPYNKKKLQPRSLMCLFLGYSPLHKGYKCLHLPSNRVYIS